MRTRPDYIIIDDDLNKHPYMDSWRLTKAIAKCQSNGKSLTFHSSGGDAAETGSAKPGAGRSANPCVSMGDV